MAMLLVSEDGREFELAVIPGSLPDTQDGFGDDRLAVLAFRVVTPDEEWEETSPTINLHEVHALADWLQSVAAEDAHDIAEVDLLGPELNFQVVKDTGKSVTIRVRFNLENRPEEFRVDAQTLEADHVDLKLEREAIARAAVQLRDDLASADRAPKDDLLGDRDAGAITEEEEELSRITADPEGGRSPSAGMVEEGGEATGLLGVDAEVDRALRELGVRGAPSLRDVDDALDADLSEEDVALDADEDGPVPGRDALVDLSPIMTPDDTLDDDEDVMEEEDEGLVDDDEDDEDERD